MKNPTQKSKSSRRGFLGKTAKLAAGTTIAGNTLSTSNAADPGSPGGTIPDPDTPRPGPPWERNDNGISKKLGGTVPHPPGSKFEPQMRREPGWMPDIEKILRMPNPNPVPAENRVYYPEEAIRRDEHGKFYHFPPPRGSDDFVQPTPHYDPSLPFDNDGDAGHMANRKAAAEWSKFNSWILGHKFNPQAGKAFDSLISDIIGAIRKYNSSLYWMRRLHFREHGSMAPHSDMPPRNPKGDKDDNLPVDQWPNNLSTKINAAISDWERDVRSLTTLLAGGAHGFRYVIADMVEVNNYIVSMRIIAQVGEPPSIEIKGKKIKQIGGSSSSHIYISSPFCSAGC